MSPGPCNRAGSRIKLEGAGGRSGNASGAICVNGVARLNRLGYSNRIELANETAEAALMKFRPNPLYQDLRSEVTPEALYLDRRAVLRAAGVATAGAALGVSAACAEEPRQATSVAEGQADIVEGRRRRPGHRGSGDDLQQLL
jgi:hypothetical protein